MILGVTWENLFEKIGEDNLGPMRDGVEKLINLIELLTNGVGNLSIGWINSKIAFNSFMADARNGVADLLELMGKGKGLLQILNPAAGLITADPSGVARLRQNAGENEKKAAQGAKDLMKALGILKEEQKKGTGVALELTEAEDKLSDSLKRQREEWEKLVKQAKDAVNASSLEKDNLLELLKARKLSVDAMELQKAVQDALSKAQKAGIAATSEQRMEIVRNTIAVFQAKNAIDKIGESEQQTKDILSDSNRILLEQVQIWVDLAEVTREFGKAVSEVNAAQVREGGAEATAFTRGRIDYANEWREAWKSASQVANEEIEKVENSLLTIQEKELAISQIRSSLMEVHLDELASFFNTIGNMFGGFAADVANFLSKIQQGVQAGNQLASALGGANTQWGAMLGAFGGTVAAFSAVYSWVDADITRRRNRRYTTSTSVGIVDGDMSSPSYLGDGGEQLSNSLRGTLDSVLRAIGGFIDDLPNIEIQVRKDGENFKATVAGVFVGIFDSMEEATNAAIMEALDSASFAGLSELVQTVLERTLESSTADINDLMSNLDFARRLESQNLPDEIRAMFGAFEMFREDWGRAMELFRGDLASGSEGFDSTITQFSTSLWDTYNNLRGIIPDPKEEAERLRTTFNAQRTIIMAQLDLMIAQIDAQREEVNSRRRLTITIVDGVRTLVDITDILAGSSAQLEEARNNLLRLREGLPPELLPGQVKPQGNRGGGGGNRDSIRDFISDRTFNQSLRNMSELDAAMAQVNREFEEQIRQAGRDQNARRQLIALRDEEIRQLQREHSERTVEGFQDFVGGENPFAEIRQNAQGLIEDIQNSVFGDARKQNMIRRVLGEIDRQIDQLGKQEAVNLFGSLFSDLQKFGATEQQLTQIRNTSMYIEHQLNLDNYRKRIALLKVEGNLAPAIIATLEAALGTLEGVNLEEFFKNNPIDISGSVEITDGNLSNNFESTVENVDNELNQLAESFKRAKEDIKGLLDDISLGNLGIVAPIDAFDEAKKQYQETLASAQSGNIVGLEAIDDVGRQYIEALKSFSPELAAIELPKIKTDLSSLLSLSTVRDNNLTYTEKFANNQQVTNDTLMKGFTDLSNSNHTQTEIQTRMLNQLQSMTNNQAELNARLSRLESGGQGNKRAIGE